MTSCICDSPGECSVEDWLQSECMHALKSHDSASDHFDLLKSLESTHRDSKPNKNLSVHNLFLNEASSIRLKWSRATDVSGISSANHQCANCWHYPIISLPINRIVIKFADTQWLKMQSFVSALHRWNCYFDVKKAPSKSDVYIKEYGIWFEDTNQWSCVFNASTVISWFNDR